MASPLIRRIEREAGVDGLADVLAERISSSDLTSLLLEVVRRRSAGRRPADLVAQRGRDRTLSPAAADGRLLHRLRGLALEAASGFDALELAPVSPLGLNAVLAGIDQNNALATVRGSEVLADPTTAMALECARRWRAGQPATRLCATSRLLRLQPFDGPGLTQHFAVLGLVSAGRSAPAHGFELAALREHARVHLRLLAAVQALEPRLRDVTVEVSDAVVSRTLGELGLEPPPPGPAALAALGAAASRRPLAGRLRRLQRLGREVFAPLAEEFPAAAFSVDLGRQHGLGYYDGLLLATWVTFVDGRRVAIGDGGSVPWLAALAGDARARLLVSGVGLDLLAGQLPHAGGNRGGP